MVSPKVLILALMGVSSGVFAFGVEGNTFQLGLYASSITYKEPSVMTEDGYLTGILGRFSVHKNGQALLFDINYSSGDMDYDGSGTINKIPDSMLEVRGMLGQDFYLRRGARITPYIGLGYRNLNDDSSYMASSTGALGYERDETYWYAPIGVEVLGSPMHNGWSIGGRVEYDYLIKGINHTYLSSIPGYSDITLKQNSGSGYKVSAEFSRPLSGLVVFNVEPFYAYWHIDESEITSSDGSDYIEPDNNSREWGVALSVAF